MLQSRRVDLPGDLTQVVQRVLGRLVGLADQRGGPVGIATAPGPPEQHAQGDEPLLEAVVQVALDASAFGVHGRDDPRAALRQLVHAALQQFARAGRQEGAGQAPVDRVDAVEPLEQDQEEDRADARLDQEVGQCHAPVGHGLQHDGGQDGAHAEQPQGERAQGAGQ